MRRFGPVCCRWHVAVLAVLFACSLMSLFCLGYRRFLYVSSPLFRRNVVIFPSCYLSFFDSYARGLTVGPCPGARVPVNCPCSRVPVIWLCVRVPVCPWPCPWIALMPVCPCARRPVRRPISHFVENICTKKIQTSDAARSPFRSGFGSPWLLRLFSQCVTATGETTWHPKIT